MKIAPKSSSEIERRVKAFKKKWVEHPNLEAAKDAAWKACSRIGGEKVAIITGSTGVGKTTLAHGMFHRLRDSCDTDLGRRKDIIPVVGLSAASPIGRAFCWKDLYIRMLDQARDPVTNRSLLAPTGSDMFGDVPYDTPADRMVVDKLRRCVEKTLTKRETRWLIIDEAHHMLLHKDPHVNQVMFEGLKSLAIETKLTIVLCGTFKLLDIRDQSAQLVRRSDLIHFQRYDLENRDHQKGFRRVLRAFEGFFDLREPVDLVSDWHKYFVRSVGCVGILKDWLTKVYERALDSDRDGIDLEFAMSAAHSNKELITIAKEAQAGEAKLLDAVEKELIKVLRPQWAAKRASDAARDRACEGAGATPEPAKTDRSACRTANQRVGQRLPKRDPVGRSDHAF